MVKREAPADLGACSAILAFWHLNFPRSSARAGGKLRIIAGTSPAQAEVEPHPVWREPRGSRGGQFLPGGYFNVKVDSEATARATTRGYLIPGGPGNAPSPTETVPRGQNRQKNAISRHAGGQEGPPVGVTGPSVRATGPSVGATGPSVRAARPSVGAARPSGGATGPAVGAAGPSVRAA